MIVAVDKETNEYCHYEGMGVWVVNQKYKEVEPRNQVSACTLWSGAQETGIRIAKMKKHDTDNSILLNNMVIIPRGCEHITPDIKVLEVNPKPYSDIVFRNNAELDLEILNHEANPPVSRKVLIKRVSIPEMKNFSTWTQVDPFFRSYIGQEETS